MKILKLQAENVKKLKAIEITPDGDVIKITGKNEQGKSTVLESILMALCGTKYVPEQPIHQGEKKASTVIYLGTNDCRECEKECKHPGYVKPADCPNIELIVARSFTESGSYLKVENKDGMGYKSPQKILDKLIGNITFDPLEFARAKQDKQVETLLKIAPLDIDIEKVKGIAKIAFQVSDNPITTLKNAYQAVYDNRTFVNKQKEVAKKSMEGMGTVEKAEPVSVTELVTEKERLEAVNRENQKKREGVARAEEAILALEDDAENIRTRIKELQEQLKQKEQIIKDSKDTVAKAKKNLEKLQDHDLTDINNRIANADAQNEKAKNYEKYQEHKASFELHEKDSKDHTKRLADIMAYKEELVAKANFPIPGLNFKGGGVEYLDLPFEQASGVQKLEVSLAVGMAMNPDLRVILIDEGSYVDSDHMKVIEKMAAEKGYQIWMVTGGEDKTVGVYIEDGMVATEEKPTESEAS